MLRFGGKRLFWWAANKFWGDEEIRDFVWSEDISINRNRDGLLCLWLGLCPTALHRATELLQ